MSINKTQVKQRFARAKQSYTQQAIAQQQICDHLYALTMQHAPFKQVFEIGCGSGNLTYLIAPYAQTYIANDLYADVKDFLPKGVQTCIGDAEQVDFPQSDLIVSSSALQWMNLPVVLQKAHNALVSRGWLCVSTFGTQNVQEVKALTGQGLEYYSKQQLCNLFEQYGFEVLHAEEQTLVLEFETPLAMLHHLKETGVTANQANFRWTKQSLKQFCEQYQQHYQNKLTYHPIYLIARRKQ